MRAHGEIALAPSAQEFRPAGHRQSPGSRHDRSSRHGPPDRQQRRPTSRCAEALGQLLPALDRGGPLDQTCGSRVASPSCWQGRLHGIRMAPPARRPRDAAAVSVVDCAAAPPVAARKFTRRLPTPSLSYARNAVTNAISEASTICQMALPPGESGAKFLTLGPRQAKRRVAWHALQASSACARVRVSDRDECS